MSSSITAPKTKQYNIKQSKFEQVPKVPFRGVIVSPSGGGKSVTINNMITNLYDKVFNRVYIFSSSIHIDDNWISVKNYLRNCNIHDEEDDPIYFEKFNEFALDRIIDLQEGVIKYLKAKKSDKLFSILVVLDDVSDDQKTRNSEAINKLFIRGRHMNISIISSVQKYTLVNTIPRTQATFLLIFRIRNNSDLELIKDENSGLTGGDKKLFLDIYKTATEEPYSFLFINYMVRDRSPFMIKFDKILNFEE